MLTPVPGVLKVPRLGHIQSLSEIAVKVILSRGLCFLLQKLSARAYKDCI